ncbi:DUF4132 domain-containing protein [Propioniciclava coleopterorum]|uniref:DUF4132 domain-containing protein n=1 Tax=Propioniciclava coleopterorum TaxID=2714937 RepID=A0A6G7Y5E6_9ACTN|nr:DUF4132 domain-containing protein [Propioniciclava coleopterorum]QIK72035.1 DUF4132 domain-containing protein [Propioniciclava coleopterorum]
MSDDTPAVPNPCAPVPPSRLEWAGYAWGEPLPDLTPDPAFDRAAFEAAVARYGVHNGQVIRSPRLPFDTMPALQAVRLLDRMLQYHDDAHQGATDVLTVVLEEGADAIPGEFIRFHAGHVLAVRAVVVPQLPPARLARWRAEAERAALHDLGRLLASAALAEPAAHLAALAAAPDDLLRGHHLRDAAALLCAVADPDERLRHARRWGVPDMAASHLDVDVVHVLGIDPVPALAERVAARTDAAEAAREFAALTAVPDGAAAAPAVGPVLALARSSAAIDLARDWLAARPAALAAYVGYAEADRPLLSALLARARARGANLAEASDPVLRGVLAELAEADARPAITPPWWAAAVAAEKKAPKPTGRGGLSAPREAPWFARPDALPPVLTAEGDRLAPDVAAELVAAAARGAKDPDLRARPLVAAAREHLEESSRERLAIALFDGYLASGADAKLRAYAIAAGLLGGPAFVDHAAPLVMLWPGRGAYQRSVLVLTAFAATGSRHAMTLLSDRFAKVKTRKVREGAEAALAKAAVAQGMTPDAYEDTLVPDGGLDARGGLDLSYGTRCFRATLLPDGSTPVRELAADGRPLPGASGRPQKSLPAPRADDDPAAVAHAKATLTATRRALRGITSAQTRRLERALVTGRTWTGDQLRAYLAHPVLGGLARPLVWITDDGRTIRATEEGEFVTAADDPGEPAPDETLRLAHPLLLPAPDADAWRAALREHDLIAPFDQLDRPVAALPADAVGADLPGRLLPVGIHPGTFASTVERAGWTPGPTGQGGYRDTWTLRGDEVTLTMVIAPGVHPMGMADGEPVAVASVGATAAGRPVAWPDVDRVLASEVLTLLDRLTPA